jgi:F420-dependent oxidoreductase-like protein
MRLGLDIAQHQLTWDELLRRARYAEELGFDGVWVFDHFKALYGNRGGPCFEAWTLLAALGAATARVRLGALVSGMTYRHPSLLAAEAVTVDHVSNGRLELAVGAAWYEGEHRELGFPFPRIKERAERLEESVQVMRLLMTGDDVSFDGRYYQLRHATYRPRPVQQPHPPIWIGASGEQLMLPIVARRADVWHTYGTPDELGRKSALLDDLALQSGRDPASIARSTSLSISESLDRVRRTAEALRQRGFSYLVVSWPSEGQARLDEFARQVMPELLAA